MHFQLPSNLREEVAVYDPALKAMVQAQKRAASGKSKKSSAPLGLPDSLLPEDVICKESQLEIVKRINNLPAADRHEIIQTDTHLCLVYHHESLWVAAWHRVDLDNLTGPESKYVYGLTVAHKAAPSTANKVGMIRTGDWSKEFNKPEEMQEIAYGRTVFMQRSKLFTAHDIRNGNYTPGWSGSLNSWGKTVQEKNRASSTFAQSIRDRIPSWDDRSLFARLNENKSVASLLRLNVNGSEPEGELTAEHLIQGVDESCRSFFNTPYFRREIQSTVDKINQLFSDPTIRDSSQVKAPYCLWKQQRDVACLLIQVYGQDTPLDYVQKMFEIGSNIYIGSMRQAVRNWMTHNVPIASFVLWFERAHKDAWQAWNSDINLKQTSSRRSDTGHPQSYFRELADTCNMLDNLHDHQTKDMQYHEKYTTLLQLEAPSRWRLVELHDHVSSKLWLTRNKNEDLPQDLFPEPVKVNHLGSVWTFFQPRDIHQLGQWGQAVRNCVGNASSYREGVKKKTHFIVLAMIDQKPRFTIQLRVRNGVLEVDQIADVGNARLNDDDRASYELTFSMALKIRDNQIAEQRQLSA